MSRAQSLSVVLAVATLGGPLAAAHAQGSGGAGDTQYQDPFSGSGGGSSTTHHGSAAPHHASSVSSSSTAAATQASGLSQNPNLGGGSSNGNGNGSSSSGTSGSSSSSATLPNTGSDPRLLVLAGLALLLSGIGLRLRTADERF